MLAIWAAIEADFQRDYGLDLPRELPRMSWRRFKTLLAGLGPDSAAARAQLWLMERAEPPDEGESQRRERVFTDLITSLARAGGPGKGGG